MAIRPWWERFPGRLEWEIAQLEAVGLEPQIEEGERRAEGLLEVNLTYRLDGRRVGLTASYPDFYPYVRPEVSSSDLRLARHQNPIAGNLCLIGRSTENWRPSNYLAELIVEQLPRVLAAVEAKSRGEASPFPEEAQGEPASNYHISLPSSSVLVDSAWDIASHVTHGHLEMAVDRASLRNSHLLRAVVTKVASDSGQQIASAPSRLAEVIPASIRARLDARWVRLTEFPPQAPDGSLQPLFELLARTHRRKRHEPGRGLDGVDVVGIVFPEELTPDRVGDGWAFVVQPATDNDAAFEPYLARAMRAGSSDLRARIPSLVGLEHKRVMVAGLGGIGGPSALEFAKAGVGEVRLLDHDVVEPGPSVRWPFGIHVAGHPKTQVLHEAIAYNWPYTEVRGAIARIGSRLGGPSDAQIVDEMLDGVDLVYDATTEYGLHQLLSDLALERGIPYVEASTRAGAWGGHVARVLPEDGRGCWTCMELLMRDREDAGEGAVAEAGGLQQPVGCADPTFSGTGFDLLEFALAGVRLAVATLLRGAKGYPDPDWDVAIINLRNPDGSLGTPRWTTFALTRHPECPRCGGR